MNGAFLHYFDQPSEIQTHIPCMHSLQMKQNFLSPVKHEELIPNHQNNNCSWQLCSLNGSGPSQNAFSTKTSELRTFFYFSILL